MRELQTGRCVCPADARFEPEHFGVVPRHLAEALLPQLLDVAQQDEREPVVAIERQRGAVRGFALTERVGLVARTLVLIRQDGVAVRRPDVERTAWGGGILEHAREIAGNGAAAHGRAAGTGAVSRATNVWNRLA